MGTVDARTASMLSSSSARAAIGLTCAAILSGCEMIHSPGAPTASAPAATSTTATIRLTVRVLVRGSEEPVTAATVFRDQVRVGQTDGEGVLHAEVPLGVEFAIDITAPGFM